MVVARVGVAAAAVGQIVADRVIVIALHHRHAALEENRKHAIGMRPEAAQVAQAEGGGRAAAGSVVEHGLERERVVVHAAEEGVAR